MNIANRSSGRRVRQLIHYLVAIAVLLGILVALSEDFPIRLVGTRPIFEDREFSDPTTHDLFPEYVDEQGCLLGSEPEDRRCPAPASRTEDEMSAYKSAGACLKYGFRGAGCEEPVFDAPTARVVESSISVVPSSSGLWEASGLVVNLTKKKGIRVTIGVDLVDRLGSVIHTESVEAAIDPINPGEPAPFRVTAGLPFTDVDTVRWVIHAVESSKGQDVRRMVISEFWEAPVGTRQRMDIYLHKDPARPPYPYLLFGSIRNISQSQQLRPKVLVAWLENNGRLQAFQEASLKIPTSKGFTDRLDPGAFGDFLISISDSSTAESLLDKNRYLWGYSE